MSNIRNTGIELLKIVLMYMICLLHVLGEGGILSNSTSALNFLSIYTIEELAICAVDCFALISGYCFKNKPKNYKRIIKLWITAFFYTTAIATAFFIINKQFGVGLEINGIELLHSLLPVSYGNWYFSAYFFTFFFSIFIDKSIDNLSTKESRYMVLIFIFVYSILNLVNDRFFGKGGSAFWLTVLYAFGALMKKSELFDKCKTKTLIILYIVLCGVTWLLNVYFDISIWGYYTSPTVLLAAMILLIIFSRVKIESNLIKNCSNLTFGVYLFHNNKYINDLFIKDKFIIINKYNFIIVIILAMIIALIIFIVSLIIDYFRVCFFNAIKIDDICSKIENIFRTILIRTEQILWK